MRRQKGFTGVEMLAVLVVLAMMIALVGVGRQALVPAHTLATGEYARQWAMMAEVLRTAHGQVRAGPARNFLSSFRTAPSNVLSPFATEYRLHLPARSVAEVSVLTPMPRRRQQWRIYYAQPQPHSRASVDKVLLYQQTVR